MRTLFLGILLLVAGCAVQVDPKLVGTAAQRIALCDDLIEKTERREAYSPVKEARLGIDVRADMRAVRPDFAAAEDGQALFAALTRLSAARRDRHLRVELVDRSLFDPTPFLGVLPLRFMCDFGRPGDEQFFVADIATHLDEIEHQPTVGDVVTHVNGMTVAAWCQAMRPYVRASTEAGMWDVLARTLSRQQPGAPAVLNRAEATLGLARIDGTTYTVTVPYVDRGGVRWKGLATRQYPDFRQERVMDTFTLYVHVSRPILLLQWNNFGARCVEDTRALVELAARRQWLEHALVVDATRARGGARGATVLQMLSPQPFKTTFGNLRISDATEMFCDGVRAEMERRQVGRSWLREWLDSDVAAAIRAGADYSNNVPFKLAHLPKDSDGIIEPAELGFRGPLVCLFGPHGGSHLDQFAAMVVDNALGYTIGMPTGGYSNTWEWAEEVGLPDGPPLVRFMWTIGQTIRPNGEVLEGNPAAVDLWLPPTRTNFSNYHAILLKEALAYLDRSRQVPGD